MERLAGWVDDAAWHDESGERVDEQIGGVVEVIQRFLDVLLKNEAVDHAAIIASILVGPGLRLS